MCLYNAVHHADLAEESRLEGVNFMIVGSACEPLAGHRGRDRLVASEQLNKAEPNDQCAVDPARRVLAEPGGSNDVLTDLHRHDVAIDADRHCGISFRWKVRKTSDKPSDNDSIRPQIECDVVRRHDLPELR